MMAERPIVDHTEILRELIPTMLAAIDESIRGGKVASN